MSERVRHRLLNWVRLALAWGVIAGAALLVLHLLGAGELSSEAPAFASVGTAPYGCAALFGAYRRAGLGVTRGWDVDSIAAEPPGTTVAFVIGAQDWNDELDRALDHFVREGGRLILAAPPWFASAAAQPQAAPTPPAPLPPLRAALGAKIVTDSGQAEATSTPSLATAAADVLPSDAHPLPLWTPAKSLQLARGWTPLFRNGGRIVAAERNLGEGTVILFSEATFLGNDALSSAADPALLSWLTGGRASVFVDESSHGLAFEHGILWLMTRYRLQAALILLLGFLALLAWALSSGLELPPATAPAGEEQAIESGMVGLVRLLQRAIPPQALLEECARRAPRSAAAPESAGRLSSAAVVAAFNRRQAAVAAERTMRRPGAAVTG